MAVVTSQNLAPLPLMPPLSPSSPSPYLLNCLAPLLMSNTRGSWQDHEGQGQATSDNVKLLSKRALGWHISGWLGFSMIFKLIVDIPLYS